jgi:hypothetical protein
MPRASQVVIAALVLAGCSGPELGEPVGPCTVYKPDARGGGYDVGDAGLVTVYLEDEQLVLVQIMPDAGWEAELVEEVDGEITIAFTQGGERVTFGAQIDGSLLAANWCP